MLNKLEKKERYNNKILMKFLQFLSHEKPYKYKEIVGEKSDEFNKRKNAIEQFIQEKLSVDSLTEMLSHFSKVKGVNLEAIIIQYDSMIAKDDIEEGVKLFIMLVKSQVFLENTNSISKIMLNKAIVDLGYNPLVFFVKDSKKLFTYIQTGYIERVNKIIYYLYCKTQNKYNRSWNVKTMDEITSILHQHQDMIKDVYCVKKLGVYGSYHKDVMNVYSDLDIWVEFDGTPVNETKVSLKYFLHVILGLYIDLTIKTEKNCVILSDSTEVF